MSRAELIYPLRKHIEAQLRRAEADPHNRDILFRYYKVRCSQVALATVLGDFVRLNILSKLFAKKFEDAKIEEIEDLVFKIDQRKNSDNTKNKFRKTLKAFYRWLKGCPKGEFPPEVKWITLKKIPLVTVTAEQLPTFEECLRVTEYATNLRDKALLQCKLDAGCRIGEILTAKVGEVEFNEYGAIIQSDGKTGRSPLILTWSAKILALWLDQHPFRNDKGAPLWPGLGCSTPKQLSYDSIRMSFKKCVKRAGHQGRIWLHLLKHVSCTFDSDLGLPDSYRKYKHHWTPNSVMPKVYEHLSNSVITKIQHATLQHMGLANSKSIPAEEHKPPELLKICKRCQFENPRDSKCCNRCYLALDDAQAAVASIAKAKLNAFIDRLAEDPKKLEKFLSMIP
jgi:site-specific recombinase XerD